MPDDKEEKDQTISERTWGLGQAPGTELAQKLAATDIIADRLRKVQDEDKDKN